MTLTKYTIGFVLSLFLTLTAYVIVTRGIVDGTPLLMILGGLAVVQMIVQLVYFLHLDKEVAPRYRVLSFIYMAGSLIIIVAGSIWIMQNMDYNMTHMTPEEKTNYMMTQHDKGF
jgi:cytochrome o ubiquinol oxidase operon protein cyoD